MAESSARPGFGVRLRRRVQQPGTLHAMRMEFQRAVALLPYSLVHEGRAVRAGGAMVTYTRAPSPGERCIEVPLTLAFLARRYSKAMRVLEVGNVLRNWPGHDYPREVVDKYEVGPRINNTDIVDLRPALPYDLVVSVSTLEHVGFDEPVRDPGKVRRAARNLIDHCLAPGGWLFVTVPLGYNPSVDALLREEWSESGCVNLFRRTSVFNLWEPASWHSFARRYPVYDRRYRAAEAIATWEAQRP
jgi:hypothetical protein